MWNESATSVQSSSRYIYFLSSKTHENSRRQFLLFFGGGVLIN